MPLSHVRYKRSGTLVRKECWRRQSTECRDSSEGDQHAEVLGACHRVGCAVVQRL